MILATFKVIFFVFCFAVAFSLGTYATEAALKIIPVLFRKREVNRRIIRQAKAAGVWGDIEKMGGKALELYARKVWGIYREVDETDAHLRFRIYSKRKGQF